MTKNRSLDLAGGEVEHASFRDPAGFIYKDAKGRLLRAVTEVGAVDFELLHSSGLYDELVASRSLVPHRRLDSKSQLLKSHAVIQPERVGFITYPFEWCFSQLRDAALLTLKIQKQALKHEMTLRDASAYNVQFVAGRPIFIDTLSFGAYVDGEPWQAYRQFCQHFLAPLALMSLTDLRLSQLLRTHIDGIPLDLAAELLPRRARLRAGLLMHLFLHARAQKAKQREYQRQTVKVHQRQQLAILDSLERTVKSLRPPTLITEWGDYYDNTNYSQSAADHKAKLLSQLVQALKVRTALDVGGNNGHYSRVLNRAGLVTVCSDIDPNAVEANYLKVKKDRETDMIPVLVDFTNPGGALGWRNHERSTVVERFQVDMVMALAVIHHLAISNNLPFSQIAEYFRGFAPHLLIEFVPKSDSQVQKLLSTRKDIFPDYNEKGFEAAFSQHFRLIKATKIKGTKRTLYLFRKQVHGR